MGTACSMNATCRQHSTPLMVIQRATDGLGTDVSWLCLDKSPGCE